jgi:hypothetical protein
MIPLMPQYAWELCLEKFISHLVNIGWLLSLNNAMNTEVSQ